MGNQVDTPALNAAPIVGDAPAPQNGASLDASASAVEKAGPPRIDKDLASSDLFLNRELTWLSFNRRVLAEAEDERNPLLERLKFLAITASNLDEFFMKRIGGLKQQVAAGVQQLTVDGRTPSQQIAECYADVHAQEQHQREILAGLLTLLEAHGIGLVSYQDLSAEEQSALRESYFNNIFPLVTPLAINPAHPFPFVSNLSLNLLVTVRGAGDGDSSLARVKVPVGAGIQRFLRVGQPTTID